MPQKIRLSYDILAMRAIETESGVNIDDALRRIHAYEVVDGTGDNNHPDVRPGKESSKILYIVRTRGELDWKYAEWIWYKDGSVEKWVCVGGTTSPDDSWKRWSEARNSIATGDNSVYVGSDNTIERNDGYAFGTRNTISVTDDKDYTGSEAVSIGRDNVSLNSIDSYNFGHDNEVSGGNPDDIDNKLAMNLGAGNKVVREGVNIGKENASDTFGITIGQKNNSHNAAIVLGENNVANRSSIAMGKRSVEMPANNSYPAMLIGGKYYPVVKSSFPDNTWAAADKVGFDSDGNLVNLWTTTSGETGHIAHINTRTKKVFFVALNSGNPVKNGEYINGYTDDNGNFVEASVAPDPDHPIELYYRIVHNGVTFVGTTSYNPDPMDDQGAAGLGIDFACAAYFCVPNPAIQIDTEYDIEYLIEQKVWFPAVYRCGNFLGRTNDEQDSTIWINVDENRAVRYAGAYSSYAPAYAPKNKVAVTGFDKDGMFYPYNGHNNGTNELYVKVVPNSDIVMHAFTKDEYEEIGVKDFAELATWIPADENSIAIGDAQTVHGKSIGISSACARLPWAYETESSRTYTELGTSGESEPFDITTIVEHDDTGSWPSDDTEIAIDDVSAGSIGMFVEQNLAFSKKNSIKNGSVGIGDQNTATDASITIGSNIVADSHSYAFGADNLHASGKSIVIGREGPVAEAGSIAIGMAGGYANCGSLIFGHSSISAGYGSLALGYSGASAYHGSVVVGCNGAYTYYGSFLFGSGGNVTYGSYGFGQGTYAYQGAFSIGRNARATYGGMTLSTGNGSPFTGRAATGYLVRYRNPDGYYAPVSGNIRVKSGYTITRVRVLTSVWYNDTQYDYAVIGDYRDSDGYFNGYYNVKLYLNGALVATPGKSEVRTAFQNYSEDRWMVSDGSTFIFLSAYTDNSCTDETSNLKSLKDYLEIYCRTFTKDSQLYVYANANGYPDTGLTYEYISLNLCSFDVYSSWTGVELGYSSDGWDMATALGGNSSGVAIGRMAHAEGSSVAIGINNSNETGGNTVGVTNSVGHRGDKFPTSLGWRIYDNYTSANGYSIAVGDALHAEGRSMAFGINTKAYGNSIVFGRDNVYADNYSLAIGQQGVTAKDCAVAIGANSNYASGYALALGSNGNYANGYSVAVGWNSNRAVDYSTAFGDSNTAEMYSTVFGKSSKAVSNSFAVGKNSFAFDYSFVVGADSSAYNNAVSIGVNNTAYENSLSFGRGNYAHHRGIAFGESNSADGNSFVAGMSNSAKNQSVAIGFENSMSGSNSEYGTLLGHSNTVLAGGYNVGFGKNNSTSREAIAIGVSNSVHGWSIGIGTGNSSTVSGGGHATIIGYNNKSLSDMETRTWEDTSSSTTYYLPLNSYYDYSWSEQIYTPDEIGPSGYIGSLSFCVSSYSTTRYLNIYLANTTKDRFTGNYDWVLSSSATLVFSGNVTFNVGWNTIPLNTSFQYDDSKNLCVIVVDNTGSYSSNMYFKSMSPGDGVYRSMYTYQDGSSYNPSSSSTYGYLTDNRPFIRFLIGGSTVSVPKIVPLSGSIPTNSILIGALNESNHFNSILIGVGNQSDSPHIIRDGEHYNTNDDDGFMIAVGRENYVGRNYDIAIGCKSVANGGENVSIQHSTAEGYRNLSMFDSTIYGTANAGIIESKIVPLTADDQNYGAFTHNFVVNSRAEYSGWGGPIDPYEGGGYHSFHRNVIFDASLRSDSTSTVQENFIFGGSGYQKTSSGTDNTAAIRISATDGVQSNIILGLHSNYSNHPEININANNTVMSNFMVLPDVTTIQSLGELHQNQFVFSTVSVTGHSNSSSLEGNIVFRSSISGTIERAAENILFGKSNLYVDTTTIGTRFALHNILLSNSNLSSSAYSSFWDGTSQPCSNNVLIGSEGSNILSCFSYTDSSGGATIENALRVYNFGDNYFTRVAHTFTAGNSNTITGVNLSFVGGHANYITSTATANGNGISGITVLGSQNQVHNTHSTGHLDRLFIAGDQNNVYNDSFDNVILGSQNDIQYNSSTSTDESPAGSDAYPTSRVAIIGHNNHVGIKIHDYAILGIGNDVTSTTPVSAGLVQGSDNVAANGSNIVILGNGNAATGHNSVAIGMQLISNQWQTVIGKYNTPIAGPNRLDTETPQDPTKALFIIGNGYSATDVEDWQDETYITRSNAMEVYADGTVKANAFVTDTDLTLTAGTGVAITEDANLHTVTISLNAELQQVLASHPGADGKRYTLECNNGQLGWVEVGVATV